jgi:hypothetical protein
MLFRKKRQTQSLLSEAVKLRESGVQERGFERADVEAALGAHRRRVFLVALLVAVLAGVLVIAALQWMVL